MDLRAKLKILHFCKALSSAVGWQSACNPIWKGQCNAISVANELEPIPLRPTVPVSKVITDSNHVSLDASRKETAQASKYISRKLSDTSSLMGSLFTCIFLNIDRRDERGADQVMS